MTVRMHGSASIFGFAAAAIVLAGCSSTGDTRNLNVVGQAQPQQLAPVQGSTVAQNTLPPLGGVQGQPAPGLSGQPTLGGVQAQQAAPGLSGQPTLGGASTTTQTAATGGSSVSLDPLAANIGTGPEGVWTVVSGQSQCRLNLPLTAGTAPGYYRASAPGCTLPGLASVSGWRPAGSQIQLVDSNNAIIAFLAPSGGSYIGTLAGGQPITMQR
ncbi:AprI/Inh family metalloprotease inhibitor [Devosia nitrariae]|uniref:Alkaline proteinase inhibitor/ Outer membrane lipoprotein Omp19 domain-containing protein n=1 Tax=Devosia nitrariae TaxID=2071872 RepID=A0ABQ5W3W9_9HYPH|nr:AprI/Inh family metalloprotease inhibitor [Devosia nitrariae]GLQ54355.1 hypothetical protein GCM10010862_16140 [Devosia nitrariae]